MYQAGFVFGLAIFVACYVGLMVIAVRNGQTLWAVLLGLSIFLGPLWFVVGLVYLLGPFRSAKRSA